MLRKTITPGDTVRHICTPERYIALLTTEAACCSVFFFSSRRRHTRLQGDWSSDVCSSDLVVASVMASDVVRGSRRWHRTWSWPRRWHRTWFVASGDGIGRGPGLGDCIGRGVVVATAIASDEVVAIVLAAHGIATELTLLVWLSEVLPNSNSVFVAEQGPRRGAAIDTARRWRRSVRGAVGESADAIGELGSGGDVGL